MTWHPLTIEGLKADASRQSQIAAEILAKDPSLGGVTALIMAGDIQHSERIDAMFRNKEMSFTKAARMIGSYARFDWVARQVSAGTVEPETVYRMLPELWSGSDPDDTNPIYLALWCAAWESNSRNFLADSKKPLPTKSQIYRGQDRGQRKIGIAWTLDKSIAVKFAKGAWARQSHRDGVVLTATANRKDVLAYITKRGEEEIIIDPSRFYLCKCGKRRSKGSAAVCRDCYHQRAEMKLGPDLPEIDKTPTMSIESFIQKWGRHLSVNERKNLVQNV